MNHNNTNFPVIQKWLNEIFPNQYDYKFMMEHLQKNVLKEKIEVFPDFIGVNSAFPNHTQSRFYCCFEMCLTEIYESDDWKHTKGNLIEITMFPTPSNPDIKDLIKEIPAFQKYLSLPKTVIV